MARKIILKENGLFGSTNSPNGYRYIGYNGLTASEKYGATISSLGGGSEYEDEIGNGLIKIGQVYYFKDEIKPSCGYCKISEHESAGGNLAKTHKLIKK